MINREKVELFSVSGKKSLWTEVLLMIENKDKKDGSNA